MDLPPPIHYNIPITLITESNLETEENDGLIVLHVVLFAEVSLDLLLGNRSTLGVNNLNGLQMSIL